MRWWWSCRRICTYPMVMAGVEAGLHVLCEKPMAFMADRSGGNAGGRAGAGEAHGPVHQSRAAALPLDQASARGRLHRYAYHAYFRWPAGWYPAQQPNSYFWWADARRAKGAVNELGAHMIARPRVAARRLAEHRRSRTATHRTDSGNERQQWNARSPLGRLDSAGLKDRRRPPRTVRRRGTRGS
jgi:predicted dehydrogenase